MRRQAAYLTLAIAEYFRDEDKDVLCLMDSVTRFAMAQREIGLSAGEPPTAKGYTPTVFTELPKLLERAGPGVGIGSITGIFTVLVDGDDHNEPIADAVRGILDGHIVMQRSIAERGRYPAINVLKSVSRTMPKSADPAFLPVITKARQVMATYADMEELIRLGAYRTGSSAEGDEAIRMHEPSGRSPRQTKQERAGINDPAHFAYPTYAKAAIQRRENLTRSADELRIQLEDAKALLSEAFEELKKVELLDERDQARERAEESAREQADMDSIGLMRARLGVA